MQVPKSRRLKFALVLVTGLTVSSVGCRSTRDNLSSLPGMTWLGSREDASMGSVADQDEGPTLPPPSREATPQVVTSEPSSQPAATGRAAIEYPDTGYPSLSPERHRSTPDTAGYATGQYDQPGSATRSQPAELGNATVGQTQRGFYGEQYQSTGPARGADYDPGTSNDYPSTGARDYDHLTGAGSESVGGDRWADPATAGDLSATGAAGNPPSSSAYDQVRQGIRDDWQNTTQAVSRGAEQFTQGAQDFARGAGRQVQEGVDNIRDGLRDEYQQFSQGASPQVPDSQPDPVDRYRDYPARQPEATGADFGGGPDLPATGQALPASPAQGPAGYGGAASLNPPVEAAVNGQPASGVEYSSQPTRSPSRSVEPWRPGSTGDYPLVSPGQSGALTPSGQPYVEPASYDDWGTNSPTTGWSQSQRLAPTYR